MKKTARKHLNLFLAVVLIAVAAQAFSKAAWAATGNVQVCQKNSSCTVGEFLYDDSYTPITTASCSFTSRYPNGDIFVNSQPMTSASQSDGWYSYDVQATGSAGLYRSAICCNSGSDRLCLDKSFEVATASALTKTDVADSVWNASRNAFTTSGSFGEALQNITPSANDIAAATWGYSSRSLSTFGSLISDIWNYSTRSLTDFNALASDMWNSTTRTLTGTGLSSGSLATKSDVDDKAKELKDEIGKISTGSSQTINNVQNITNEISTIKETAQETRDLVEQIVNKPVIETATTEVTIDLGAKLNETKTIATRLYTDTQSANSKMGLAILRWNSLGDSEVLDIVQEITRKLGGENDSASVNSVFGHISSLKKSWDWPLIATIKSRVKASKEVLASLQSDLESSDRSKTTYNKAKALVGLLDQLEDLIGDPSSKQSQKTLYGKLRETKLLADSLDKRSKDLEVLISRWDSYQLSNKQKRISDLSKQVALVNRIPSINKTLLADDTTSEKELRNKSYFVLGIVSANKKLLAGKTGSTMTNTWLELGSIVFKSLVTNPSTLISQTAALKYYLPQEIKKEDIIEVDEGLIVKYDADKSQYYVAGEFLLGPSETKTLSVSTRDIWSISQEEVESMRKQAEELAKPLDKTSYFAQGVTLKSDIDVSLDKVLELMKNNTTPEAKIVAYRQAEIEMKAAAGKMDNLKELVTEAGSVQTFFGFVGGAQAIAVWGLVLILIVGFVFLSVYMKTLIKQEKDIKTHPRKETVSKAGSKLKRLELSVIFLCIGIGAGLVSGVILGKVTFAEKTQKEKVLGSTIDKISTQDAVCKPKEEVKKNKTVTVIVPEQSRINVRSEPLSASTILTKLSETGQFIELERKDGWIKIDLEKEGEKGWVSEEFVKKEEKKKDVVSSQSVTISDTSTGFLRVRQTPWGQEITKIYPGDTFPLLEEKTDWLRIELKDGSSGWIFAEYASKTNS